MKALLFLIVLCPLMLPAANEISLVVAPGQAGRVNDHSVDVSQLPAGAPVRVQVVLSNYNFTLAGAEFVVEFPAFSAAGGPVRMRATDADFQGANPPVIAHSDWGTANLMVLPVDQNGFRTAAHVSLSFGVVRFGAVYRDPLDRPTGVGTNQLILAEFDFFLGNGTLASCISSQLEINLKSCTHGGSLCEFFSDELGNAVTMTSTPADLKVTLINNNTTLLKGDINASGTVDTADVIPMINCANGITPCDLDSLSPSDRILVGDFNCSGAVDTGDVVPLMNYVNGVTGSFKTAQASQAMTMEGTLAIDFAGALGSAAQFEIDFPDETIALGDLYFADPAAAQDWELYTSYLPTTQKMVVVMVNLARNEDQLPSLQLAYSGEKAGSIVHLRGGRAFDDGQNAASLPAVLRLLQTGSESELHKPKYEPTRIGNPRGK